MYLDTYHAKSHRCLSKKTLRIMDMIFITYCTTPSFLAALYTYFAGETGIVVFWTFGYNIIEGKYKVLVNFIGGLMYYTVYMEFPCFASLSVCVLVHHYELLLRDFHDDLKKRSLSLKISKFNKLLNKYNNIVENLLLLRDTLSKPLLAALLNGFLNLYLVLSFSLQEEVVFIMILELFILALTGVLLLTSLILCCSGIPEYMIKIKSTLAAIIDRHQVRDLTLGREIRLLERMEKKEIIYLSACDMVYFRKEFLLSAFGTFLTLQQEVTFIMILETIHVRINWCWALDIVDSLLFWDPLSTLVAIIGRNQISNLNLRQKKCVYWKDFGRKK
ncbi:uncharacterized protein CEXT_720041 [Caerostris extrusa]|uniref:Gustatory receptor n=1 Tax=Caerostris extrusa TaxID=172846 RepID=A0AAV4WBH6_CAEEX|nr:uncharacterized protein CEXT_720041 [Caerostris extrusa]